MKAKDVEFSPYDTAEFLRTPEEIAQYLETAFELYGNDNHAVLRALGTAARAYGIQKIADATGLQRQGLYKSLSEDGNPSFDTVVKVMDVFGIRLMPMVRKTNERRKRGEGRLRRRPAKATGAPRKLRKRA